jgi:hypothetical protein
MAHARARERARRPRRGRLLANVELRAHVQAKLEIESSPEQIAAWLRAAFPGRPGWHLCHETVYQALYLGGRGGLQRELTRRLRTSRPLRKRRRRPDQRRPQFIAPGTLIDLRPCRGRGENPNRGLRRRSHRRPVQSVRDRDAGLSHQPLLAADASPRRLRSRRRQRRTRGCL